MGLSHTISAFTVVLAAKPKFTLSHFKAAHSFVIIAFLVFELLFKEKLDNPSENVCLHVKSNLTGLYSQTK